MLSLIASYGALAQDGQEPVQTIQPTVEVKSNGFTINPMTKTLLFDLKVSPYLNTAQMQNYDQLSDVNVPKLTFADLEGSALQLITPNLLGGDTNRDFNAYIRSLKKQQLYVGLELGSVLRKPFLTLNNNYDTFSSYAPGAVTFYYGQKISSPNQVGHGTQVFVKVKLMPVVSTEDDHGNVPNVMREDEVAAALTDYCNNNPDCTLDTTTTQENKALFGSIEAGIKTSKIAIGFDLEYMNIRPSDVGTIMLNHDDGSRTFVSTRQAMETYSGTFNFDYTLWRNRDLGKLTLGAFVGADMTVGMNSARTESLKPATQIGSVPGHPTLGNLNNPPTEQTTAVVETTMPAQQTQTAVAPFVGLTAKYEFGQEGASVRKKSNHRSTYSRKGERFNHRKKRLGLIESTQGNPLNPFKRFFRWVGNIGSPRQR